MSEDHHACIIPLLLMLRTKTLLVTESFIFQKDFCFCETATNEFQLQEKTYLSLFIIFKVSLPEDKLKLFVTKYNSK